jgi:hypothetical protein
MDLVFFVLDLFACVVTFAMSWQLVGGSSLLVGRAFVGLEGGLWLSSHKTSYAALLACWPPLCDVCSRCRAPVRGGSLQFYAPGRRSSLVQFEAVRSSWALQFAPVGRSSRYSSPLQKLASAAPGKLPSTCFPCWVCFCLCLDVFLLDLLLLVWILFSLCWICLLVLLPLQCFGCWLEVAGCWLLVWIL